MATPLSSVSALARFELSDAALEKANSVLTAETDWPTFLAQIELHGLSGYVSKHLKQHELPIPKDIQLSIRALNIRHKAAAVARIKTLKRIDHAFNIANIDYLGLKGVALLPRLYLEPELRPMRDMDLLVPKAQLHAAGDALRAAGFNLPEAQPSRFMRFVHQLPNATLEVDGFVCSVEIHHNAFSSERGLKLAYPANDQQIQHLSSQDISLPAFDDITFLHQVCRHLEGLHPGGVLKLINAMDVIGLAVEIKRSGDWGLLAKRYPHVLSTLKCLHLLIPLPSELAEELSVAAIKPVVGVGEIMESFTEILQGRRAWRARMQMLFSPSDWWLHLHYNVEPNRSLLMTKLIRHPLSVVRAFVVRATSAILGG